MSSTRVLAIGAHPDDVEIICSGTLLLLAEAGCEIHVASLTAGDCGSATLPPDDIARVRLEEARRASASIGASYHCLQFRDLAIFDDEASNRRVTACVREVDPRIVFTHPPADYISDHETTSRLVRNACFAAPVRNYDTSMVSPAAATATIPYLFYAHPIEGIDIHGREVQPRLFVDISGVIDRKLAMLAHHESQREWLRAHHGLDEYLDAVKRWNAQLADGASQAAGRAVHHAEAFLPHHGHAYPRGPILRDLLGDRTIDAEDARR
jgi:LmbE family N-acetylglucosaminyl deacetylase